MEPLSLAMLASSLFKYNNSVKNAQNQALTDSVAVRGGEWSKVAPRGYEQPNLWGDLTTGATAASGIESQHNQSEQNKALIQALAGGNSQASGYGGLNFDVPSSDDFEQYRPMQYRGMR
jgi:hypothetical protein